MPGCPKNASQSNFLFAWLPQTRPAHGPRLRWKDRVSADLRKVNVSSWYDAAQDRMDWRTICHSLVEPSMTSTLVVGHRCNRTFKSRAGLARHKCISVRQLPVEAQPGARQCERCQRWFKSAGGLAVHNCCIVPSAVEQNTANCHPNTTLECCSFHCESCGRCFKSSPGFRRHNCHRGKRPSSSSRDEFVHQCQTCCRRFRRQSDFKRHKCHVL